MPPAAAAAEGEGDLGERVREGGGEETKSLVRGREKGGVFEGKGEEGIWRRAFGAAEGGEERRSVAAVAEDVAEEEAAVAILLAGLSDGSWENFWVAGKMGPSFQLLQNSRTGSRLMVDTCLDWEGCCPLVLDLGWYRGSCVGLNKYISEFFEILQKNDETETSLINGFIITNII